MADSGLFLNIKRIEDNLYHNRTVLCNIIHLKVKMKIQIVIIQEPWQLGGHIRGLKRFDYKALPSTKRGNVIPCINLCIQFKQMLLSLSVITAIKITRMDNCKTRDSSSFLLGLHPVI